MQETGTQYAQCDCEPHSIQTEAVLRNSKMQAELAVKLAVSGKQVVWYAGNSATAITKLTTAINILMTWYEGQRPMVYLHQDTNPPEAGKDSAEPTITVAGKKWTRRLQLGPTQAYIGPDYACYDGPPSRYCWEQAAPVIYTGKNREGLPMRSNTKPCVHYIDKGWCYFGKECYYHHPHPNSKEHGALKRARENAIAAGKATVGKRTKGHKPKRQE